MPEFATLISSLSFAEGISQRHWPPTDDFLWLRIGYHRRPTTLAI